MRTHPISETIEGRGCLMLDGGLAAELEARGHDLDHPLWSARLLLENPLAIEAAHLAFLNAGADCLISASYQATPQGMMELGLSRTEAARLIRFSHRLAMDAWECFADSGGGDDRSVEPLVAASIGPYGAYLADGSEYRGDYGLSPATLVDFHRERFEILSDEADLLAIETIPCVDEAIALRELLIEDGRTAAWVSFTCRDGGHLASGERIRDAAELLADVPAVVAVGVNCTAPRHVSSLVEEIQQACPDKPVLVYPNSGESYRAEDKSWTRESSGAGMENAVQEWVDLRVQGIGGCCRVAAADLKRLHEKLGVLWTRQ